MNWFLRVLSLLATLNLTVSVPSSALNAIGLLYRNKDNKQKGCPVLLLTKTTGIISSGCLDALGEVQYLYPSLRAGTISAKRFQELQGKQTLKFATSLNVRQFKRVPGSKVHVMYYDSIDVENVRLPTPSSLLEYDQGFYIHPYSLLGNKGFYVPADSLHVEPANFSNFRILNPCKGETVSIPSYGDRVRDEDGILFDLGTPGGIVFSQNGIWLGMVLVEASRSCGTTSFVSSLDIQAKVEKSKQYPQRTPINHQIGMLRRSDNSKSSPVIFLTQLIGLTNNDPNLPCPLPQENTVSLTSVAFTPVLAERLATPLKVEKCDSILQGKLLVIKLAEPVAAYPLYFTKPNLEKELTIYFTYKTTYAEVEDAISWVNVTLSDELLIDDFRRDTKMLTKSRLVEPRYIGPLTQETDFVGYLKPEGTEMAFYDSSEIKAELHKLSYSLSSAELLDTQERAALGKIGILVYDQGFLLSKTCAVYFKDARTGIVGSDCLERLGQGWLKFPEYGHYPRLYVRRVNRRVGKLLYGVPVDVKSFKKVESMKVTLVHLQEPIPWYDPSIKENLLPSGKGLYVYPYNTREVIPEAYDYIADYMVTKNIQTHEVSLSGETVQTCRGGSRVLEIDGLRDEEENTLYAIDHPGAIVLDNKYDLLGFVLDYNYGNYHTFCYEPKFTPKEGIMKAISNLPAADTNIDKSRWGVYQWHIRDSGNHVLPVLFINNKVGLIFTISALIPMNGISINFYRMKEVVNKEYMTHSGSVSFRHGNIVSFPKYKASAIRLDRNVVVGNIEIADPDINQEATVYFTFSKTHYTISELFKQDNDLLYISWDTVTFKSENQIYPYYIEDAPRYRMEMSVDISSQSPAIVMQNGKWVGFLDITEYPRTTFYKSRELYDKLRETKLL